MLARQESSGTLPAPLLDPDQIGNLGRRLQSSPQESAGLPRGGPILDPNQVGNLDLRLNEARSRLEALEGREEPLPLIRLSGFMQLDDGLFSQTAASKGRIGDIQDGVGFRRTRLMAIGKLTEFTGYSIEFDFATIGRPSFMDVWGEQSELPFLGTLRIGQFRQPCTMDSWTSVRHLEFLERSAPFQATDPFRRVGIMAYAMSEDERTSWAYSVYATGLTFWTGTDTVYSTLGDNRSGTQIGDVRMQLVPPGSVAQLAGGEFRRLSDPGSVNNQVQRWVVKMGPTSAPSIDLGAGDAKALTFLPHAGAVWATTYADGSGAAL